MVPEFIQRKMKNRPMDMGINGFKRLLKENKNLTKSQRNQAVKAYRARVHERLLEIQNKGLDKDEEV